MTTDSSEIAGEPLPVITLTFDNLGEAAEEQLGLPVPPPPHPSVEDALPEILRLLARSRLTATFFVEAINAERYPQAMNSIGTAGHELACHGWRHETWHLLTEEEKERTIEGCSTALGAFGSPPLGFRPPGGVLEREDFGILAAGGIRWSSPAGDRSGIDHGVVCLPFAWNTIDAYFLVEGLAPLRQSDGLPEAPLSPDVFARAALGAVYHALETLEPLCLVLHPFLYDTPERWTALSGLLLELALLRDSGLAWVGPGTDAASLLRTRPAMMRPPSLISGSWATSN